MFEPRTLWPAIVARTRSALACGALQPIRTNTRFIHDRGVDFLVRMVESLERKEQDRRLKKQSGPSGPSAPSSDPFLPHQPEMFVADISDTHLCLLNKFNVIEHHLLIVTRDYEDQQMLLTASDFEAVCACMSEFDALGFYNGGTVAGSSQPHKHLQMIPLPMADRGPRLPIEALLKETLPRDALGALSALNFVHAFSPLPPSTHGPRSDARVLLDLYRDMLRQVGLNASYHGAGPEKQAAPYNLLFTRQWMLLVPRSREHFQNISINALAFAGAHLVKNRSQMQALQQHGPMTALDHTAVPA